MRGLVSVSALFAILSLAPSEMGAGQAIVEMQQLTPRTLPRKKRPDLVIPGKAGPAITTARVAVLPPAPLAPSPKPLDPALLAPIEAGTPISTLREKLGNPTGGMTVAGSDGVRGTWIYALTDGRTVELRIENGLLASFQFKGPKTAP